MNIFTNGRKYVQDRIYIKKLNSVNGQIRYFNFFDLDSQNFWFSRFLKARTSLLKQDKEIAFFTVFGGRKRLDKAKGDFRVFWTGENLYNHYRGYADHMLSDNKVNLALGFDYFEDTRYLRFPLWLLYMLNPEFTDEQICDKIESLRHPAIGERSRFCAMVASHDSDTGHIRENINHLISRICQVSCGGHFMHNDDTLKLDFKDSKQEYLKQFAFNICPENSNAYGYVTEKIFECIQSGCIPIYWGSYNNPEPTIINKEAVIFFEPGKDNSKQIAFIEELYSHPKLLSEFQHQNRLLPSAEETILNMVHELANRLDNLL